MIKLANKAGIAIAIAALVAPILGFADDNLASIKAEQMAYCKKELTTIPEIQNDFCNCFVTATSPEIAKAISDAGGKMSKEDLQKLKNKLTLESGKSCMLVSMDDMYYRTCHKDRTAKGSKNPAAFCKCVSFQMAEYEANDYVLSMQGKGDNTNLKEKAKNLADKVVAGCKKFEE